MERCELKTRTAMVLNPKACICGGPAESRFGEPKSFLAVRPGCGGKEPDDRNQWPGARLVRERAQVPPAGGGGRRLRHLHARSRRHHYQLECRCQTHQGI